MGKDIFYAVIFSRRMRPAGSAAGAGGAGGADGVDGVDAGSYDSLAAEMLLLAESRVGFICFNSASDGDFGISVSYWRDLASIESWKSDASHLEAQHRGRVDFYSDYSIQVCKVERSYSFGDASSYHPTLGS